ncbi:hypothetical protein Tco_0328332 [Tanacetum coccineum]
MTDQAPKPQRSNATSSSTRPSASTRHKGKEIAKPVTPQSESVSEEDSDPEQAQRDKKMQKICTRTPCKIWPNRKNHDSLQMSRFENIAISELKKLIENCKGKSVETQFDKPSVVRQPNAQRIPKPSVLGKPTPFSNSPEMRSFQTKQSVNKTNVSDGLFKQVTQQNLPQIRKQAVRNTNVIAPGPSRNCPQHVSFQSTKEL